MGHPAKQSSTTLIGLSNLGWITTSWYDHDYTVELQSSSVSVWQVRQRAFWWLPERSIVRTTGKIIRGIGTEHRFHCDSLGILRTPGPWDIHGAESINNVLQSEDTAEIVLSFSRWTKSKQFVINHSSKASRLNYSILFKLHTVSMKIRSIWREEKHNHQKSTALYHDRSVDPWKMTIRTGFSMRSGPK